MTTREQAPGASIERRAPESELYDVMGGASRWEIRLHEHGSVALVDVMPRLAPSGRTADFAIVQAARVSYGQGTKRVEEDRGLIRYLARHRHTTPFEMVELKFHCVLPLFVARQWIRHRTANVNEYSGRYSVIEDRFYRPRLEDIRSQSTVNRQGRAERLDEATAQQFCAYLDKVEALYAEYEDLTRKGVARELARIGLPVSIYTEWYWKCDLHNLFHFLSLRLDEHAQQEMREYAQAIMTLVSAVVPIATEAFLDYELHGMRLSRLEVEAIRSGAALASDNRREGDEWDKKKGPLGLKTEP